MQKWPVVGSCCHW